MTKAIKEKTVKKTRKSVETRKAIIIDMSLNNTVFIPDNEGQIMQFANRRKAKEFLTELLNQGKINEKSKFLICLIDGEVTFKQEKMKMLVN